jgi:hypothetical protein
MENENILAPATTDEQIIHELSSRPTKQIEGSLSKFLEDVFEMTRAEDAYQMAIKQQILEKLPEMKPNELISLVTSASTNKNDLISKILSPTMQLLSAAQQNEMASRRDALLATQNQQNQPSDIRAINQAASTEALVGLQALFNLMNTAKNETQ